MIREQLWVTPLGDRVVVAPMEDGTGGDAEEMFGMAELGSSAKEKPQTALVIAVGPGKISAQTGALIPMRVQVGQQILHGRYAGTEITVEGKTFLILLEEECMAVLERKEVEVDEEEELERPALRRPPAQDAPIDDRFGRFDVGIIACVEESHEWDRVPAVNKIEGPHGTLHYCAAHTEQYQKIMGELGQTCEVTAINPTPSTE